MATSSNNDLIQGILADGFSKRLIKELGIEGESPSIQVDIISRLGQNVMDRVNVAVLKKLPEDQHPAFMNLVGSGNMMALQELVQPYIADLGQLVRDEAQKELKETVAAVNKKMRV